MALIGIKRSRLTESCGALKKRAVGAIVLEHHCASVRPKVFLRVMKAGSKVGWHEV